MFKIKRFFISLVFSSIISNYCYAAGPTVFPAGIASNAPVVTPNGVTQGTIGDAVTKAQVAIPETEKGAPNGVAGLDENGNVTSNLVTNKSTWKQSASGDIITLSQPVNYNDATHWGIDPDGYQFGGSQGNDVIGQGAPTGSRGTLASNRINCHPYGNYDAGSCLTVVNSSKIREDARAPIGGGLETSVSNLVNYVGFENVVAELDSDSPDARLILQDVSYDANHIYMPGCEPGSLTGCVPLTDDQIAQLRIGMSVTTNSLYSGMPAYAPGSQSTLPSMGLYQSFISSWDKDGKYITIAPGWGVPQSGNSSSGQIPSEILDTFWTNYKTKTVFLGAEQKDFIGHSVVYYNPDLDSSGYPKSSLSHNLEWWEVDMVNMASADYMASFHGLTLSYSGDKKPTSDSYGLFVAGGFGGGGGSLLRLTGNPGENEINSDGMKTYASYLVPATQGAKIEVGEMQGQASSNKIRLVNYLKRESSGDNGWRNTSYNIGVYIDGSQGNASIGQELSGTEMARISWNSGTNLGGIDIFANNGTDILTLKGDGSTTANGQLNANNNMTLVGTQYFQTADKTNQFSFTSGSDGSLTVNSLNNGYLILNSNTKFNGYMEIPFGAPASSTAPCTQGQMEMDADYIYSCVATNTWHRASNGATW